MKMNPITKEYAVKSLNQKIKRTEEYLAWQDRVLQSSKRELGSKQGSIMNAGGGFSVAIEYNESTSQKLLRESQANIERMTPHLKQYKAARDDIQNNY